MKMSLVAQKDLISPKEAEAETATKISLIGFLFDEHSKNTEEIDCFVSTMKACPACSWHITIIRNITVNTATGARIEF